MAIIKWDKDRAVNILHVFDKMDLKPFLSATGCSRPLIATDGKKYKWIVDARTMACYNEETGQVMARTCWACCDDDRERLRLELTNEGCEISDAIIITGIVLEHERRHSMKRELRNGSFLMLLYFVFSKKWIRWIQRNSSLADQPEPFAQCK